MWFKGLVLFVVKATNGSYDAGEQEIILQIV